MRQPNFPFWMKYTAIDFHFMRDKVQDGTLRVSHVASADQLVDALTKPQSLARLQHLCIKLGIQSKSILRGHDQENGSFESQLQSLSNPP